MTNPPGGQPPGDRPHYPPQQPAGNPPPMGQGYPPPGFPSQGPHGGYPQPPRKSRVGPIAGALVVVALVIAGVVIAGAFLTSQGTGPLASDEKKIEVAIRDFYDVLGSRGFRAAAEKACAADRAEFDAMTEEQKRQFDTAMVSVTIDEIENIVISGDSATAKITGKLTVTIPGEQPDTDTSTTEHLQKEDGKWKVCSADTETY